MSETVEFVSWPKIPRLENEAFEITEKIDGTNGQFVIENGKIIAVGSRSRWLTEDDDNFGFYKWIMSRAEKITNILEDGRYYGEFYGRGIQRGYGLKDRKFHIFTDNLERKLKKAKAVADLIEIDFTIPIRYVSCYLQHPAYYEAVKPKNSDVNAEYPHTEGIVIRSIATGKRWKVVWDKREGK